MGGRDPQERGRSATPVELFYDLTYVIAFAAAAEELAHGVTGGHVGSALGANAFAIFPVTWAWMNFTWFASAYGNDDAIFRVATLVQMIGVMILIFGLPVSFESAANGESPNNMLMVIGYVVMRVPLIGLWLRAAGTTLPVGELTPLMRSPLRSHRPRGCYRRSSAFPPLLRSRFWFCWRPPR
jgi:low temperature requirement protein LtrA